jgi:hypothetical protein
MAPEIITPRGKVFATASGRARLAWDTNFKPKWTKNYTMAQKFVDSEVLRRSAPFIPLRTGILVKTGTLGTEIGSGLVQWIAPYAKAQYYNPRPPGRETGPLRGGFWFARMKKLYITKIISGAKKLAGGGTKT